MGQYDNRTVEELIILLDERDEQIEELEQANDEIEGLEETITEQGNTIDDFESLQSDRESISEVAFKCGYQAKESDKQLMKAWLNFKVEYRI